MIPRRVNLPRVYHTPGKLVLFNLKFEKLREILIKSENILTHRSVAHADSNNEKKEVENLAGLSL